MHRFLSLVALTAALTALFLTGCSKSSPPPRGSAGEKTALLLAETTGNPYWKKRWWLEKTARLLRGGQELTAEDNPDELMKLSEEEIIRRLMKDDRFGEAMLDFNSYFLGFKGESIKSGDRYNPNLIEMASALSSAQEIMKDGDYFRIFDLTGPLYMMPLSRAARHPGEDEKQPDAEIRKKHAADLQAIVQAALELAKAPNASGEAVCKYLADNRGALQTMQSDGYPFALTILAIQINPDWIGQLETLCSEKAAPPAPGMLVTALGKVLEKNAAFFKEMQRFEPTTGYSVNKLADIRPVDLKAIGLSERWPAISLLQSLALRNSSTNMNRKRGAYVLKHYFCDDLTPLGFEAPEEHTGGAHGSDTSCYACHYKLDPMAGFFKSYGLLFANFENAKTLLFDDFATANREDYEKNWLAPAGSPRKWNIGYIRSPGAGASNIYGENLDDLSRIIRSAPEAKQCLIRRLFEYFVAPNQTVDAGYLHDLSEKLTREAAAQSSSAAVKNTIVRLLTSQAYHEHDMDPKRCYDRAPGDDGKDFLPCRVSYLLRNNCANCHDGGALSDSRLDLSHWVDTGGGVMGFPHLDETGHQKPARETLGAIIERLSTTDPKRRMPKKAITSQDRLELYSWAQETYATLPQGGSK